MSNSKNHHVTDSAARDLLQKLAALQAPNMPTGIVAIKSSYQKWQAGAIATVR
jgi:hypothetical protein